MDVPVCPRRCGARGGLRLIRDGVEVRPAAGIFRVATSRMIHFWEESHMVSGQRDPVRSFFPAVPLGCCFCQNYAISRRRATQILDGRDLTHGGAGDRIKQLC
jgi:uncharacterized Fe-S radical SAM superfamily protein PflX